MYYVFKTHTYTLIQTTFYTTISFLHRTHGSSHLINNVCVSPESGAVITEPEAEWFTGH